MTEISAKSVSDVHGIIQYYEIENNSKFRMVVRMPEKISGNFKTSANFLRKYENSR
jgi:hypothetical protein